MINTYYSDIAVNIAKMSQTQTYELKELCKDSWQLITENSQKRKLGSDFYKNGDYTKFGLVVARRATSGYPQLYRLKNLNSG